MPGIASITLIFFLVAFNLPIEARDLRVNSEPGKFTCSMCTAEEGYCSRTCTGAVCIKAIEHQGNSQRRYCMDFIEPNQPQPGKCKSFKSPLGHVETVCACTGDYCNNAQIKFENGSAVMFKNSPSSATVAYSMLRISLLSMISTLFF